MNYLQQVLARCEKATPGRWEGEPTSGQHFIPRWRVVDTVKDIESNNNLICDVICEPDDAEFIAHARTDLPELARRLQRAISALRAIDKDIDAPMARFLADELEAPTEVEK